MLLKVISDSEVRRRSVPSAEALTFAELREIAAAMGLSNSEILYLDDEGDECTVSCDHTLSEAFAVAERIAESKNSSPELKLYVGASIPRDEVATDVEGIHVRAVTMFIVLGKDQSKWSDIIVKAASLCDECAVKMKAKGYQVQTLRLVCNPFSEYLDTTSTTTALSGVDKLKAILTSPAVTKLGIRIRFALGAASSADDLKLVPALIQGAADLANCCVNIPCDELGLPERDLTEAAAACCMELAKCTARGEGNFNFTANFNMPPGCPYFPAGYNTTASGQSFALGLEFPDLMVSILKGMSNPSSQESSWTQRMAALQAGVMVHVTTLCGVAAEVSASHDVRFAGIDSSAAPSKDCHSMCEVVQLLGVEHFGAAGTLEASSFLTKFFKSLGTLPPRASASTATSMGSTPPAALDAALKPPLVGFSGFMLACLEDAGLAASAAASQFDIRALLQYSAVCGIGLDTVPIPGDATQAQISALMRDTGAMAFRLSKPLTVRLFPVPGGQAGDMTTFTSSDLCNCSIFAIP